MGPGGSLWSLLTCFLFLGGGNIWQKRVTMKKVHLILEGPELPADMLHVVCTTKTLCKMVLASTGYKYIFSTACLKKTAKVKAM